jgi:hypothetical protein
MSTNNLFSNEKSKNNSNYMLKQNIKNNINKNFINDYITQNFHKKHYGNNTNNYKYNYGYYINYDDYVYPYYIYNSQYYYDVPSYLEALSLAGIFISENDIIMLDPNHNYISSKPSNSNFFDPKFFGFWH